MAIQKSRKFKKSEQKQQFVPFEKENVVKPLKMFITIVPFGHAPTIMKMLEEVGVTFSYVTTGEGTGKNFLPTLLSVNDFKKQIIFSFVAEDKSKQVCEMLENRFSTSKAAKGISLSIKLSSVAGVSVYRFLTNVRKVKKVHKNDEF